MTPPPKKEPKPLHAAIGANLKRFREGLGMSQAAFAKGIPGLYSSNLSEIEAGNRRLTVDMLSAICRKYQARQEDVTGETGGPKFIEARADTRFLPVINEAQAGRFRETTDKEFPPGVADRYYPSTSTDPSAFYVIVRGESMVGGDIKPGDLLLVEPSRQVENGDVVLAIGPLGKTVKRFKKGDSTIVLSPMNPEFEPILVMAKEAKDYTFLKISAIVRKL